MLWHGISTVHLSVAVLSARSYFLLLLLINRILILM
jgi:hypothetical protein